MKKTLIINKGDKMKTKKQKLTLKEKKMLSKANKMKHAKGNSNYAQKSEYLHNHGGKGFEYEEKPWK